MTYYKVLNMLTNIPEFFVPDEATKNSKSFLTCFIGGEADAQARALQNKMDFEVNEAYRFVLALEVVNGTDTTWRAVELDSDPEEGRYKVFNHVTGQYEDYATKTSAISRLDELKQDFFKDFNFAVEVVDVLPGINGPYAKEVYGETVAILPVEIM